MWSTAQKKAKAKKANQNLQMQTQGLLFPQIRQQGE